MLEIRVLGPLEARGADGDVALGGAKQRLLLACLALHAGEYVPRDALIDALWPEEPPPSAGSTIESYISRLRRALHTPDAEDGVIQSGPGGYRLPPSRVVIDVEEFDKLLAAARAALAADDVAQARRHADAALSLWRGTALAGLSDQPALRADVGALEERRLETIELSAEAALRDGRAQDAVARLSSEVDRHPARERLRALLMLALYRDGRQADALSAYQDARRYLVEELGLEPGLELRDLQERILRQDPGLDKRRPRLSEGEGSEPEEKTLLRGSRRSPIRSAVAVTWLVVAVAAIVAVLMRGGGSSAALAQTLRGRAVGLLDPTSGQPRLAMPIDVVATRFIAARRADWATSYDNGTLLRIDPGHLLVTQTINTGPGATGVAVAAGDVWVASSLDGTVARIDQSTSGIVQRIAVGTDPTDVASGDGSIWVTNTADGTVSRIDAHTGEVLATTPVGPSPRGIAVGDGAVWVAVSGANVVVRIDPRSGHVLDSVPTGQGPAQVVVGRDGVWVANDLASTVSLIDPSTDTVTLTKAVLGIPAALAPVGDGVWVAASDRPNITLIQVSGAATDVELPSPASALVATPGGVLIAVRGVSADHRGGTVVMRTSFPIGQINPAACCDTPPNVRDLSYDGLLSFSKLPSSAGTLVPDLALAIPRAQAGGRLYTFRLRLGLRYWNGDPVRASDFLRGFEYAAAASSVWAGYIAALPGALACTGHPQTCDLRKAVIANDKANTVTLELSHPDPELLPALGLSGFAPTPPGNGITPGTGPYRIAQFVPNRLIVLERNTYFREWAPAAQPTGYPDRIVIQSGAPAPVDIAAVLNGSADYTFDQPTPSQLAQIEVQGPGQLHVSPSPGVSAVFLDTREPPFNDVRVRQALNLAIDRSAIVRLFGGSAAATPDCQYIPATVPGHSSYCPYTSDPSRAGRWTAPNLAKARTLIDASGTRGDSISLLTSADGFPADEATGRYIVSLLSQLGFDAHLRLVTPSQYNVAMGDYRHPPQSGTFTWIADFPSPAQWITEFLSCPAWNPPLDVNNHARFCDRQVDNLAQRAAQLEQTDPRTANELWAQADRRITKLAPWVPTVSENEIDLVSHRVGNYQYVPTVGALIDQLWVR
jgi:peptide/nickel transport system substrate-binding protein